VSGEKLTGAEETKRHTKFDAVLADE